jgi:hypothetical protein
MKTPTTVPIAKVVFPMTVPATRIQTTSYSRPQMPETKKKQEPGLSWRPEV